MLVHFDLKEEVHWMVDFGRWNQLFTWRSQSTVMPP